MDLYTQGKACKEASYSLMVATTAQKNEALLSIANVVLENINFILEANAIDIEKAQEKGRPASFIDRLALDKERIEGIVDGVKQVISLEDPCHKILASWDKDALHFEKVSVPIGVIGIIYEARPNVSVDAASLCLKSGNVCFLRGSSDTIHTNKVLVSCMQEALTKVGMDKNCIALVEDTSREEATRFMKMNDYLDLLIPRGSANLIKTAIENASVPIIETGTGNCHVYVDKEANLEDALAIIVNAKTQRVSVCNACESVLLHKDIVETFLPILVKGLQEHNVQIYADSICRNSIPSLLEATEEDYAKEYLDYALSMKVVEDVEEAIQHINKYNTKHSDVIVSANPQTLETFFNKVDCACVYANASSRFSDGNEFGFGAEIGISTQKIHARGPMGLEALTSYKYQIVGNGTIRK